MSYVKDNLRYLMRQRGWSIPDVAEKSGIPQTTVKSILYGLSKNQRLNTLEKLATVFECSISTLIGENLKEAQKQAATKLAPLDEWRVALFKQAVELIDSVCSKNGFSFGKNHMIRAIDDVYGFLLQKAKTGQEVDAVDEDFIVWTLTKTSL